MRMLALALMLMAGPAAAEQRCGDAAELRYYLWLWFGEEPVKMRTIDRVGVVAHWYSNGDDSWTIAVTSPDGAVCVMASSPVGDMPL